MASTTQKFVLVGANAGKTLRVNGHEFIDGEFTFQGNTEQVAALTNIFSYYGVMTVEAAERMALEQEIAALRASAPAVAPVDNAPANPPVVADVKVTLEEALGQLDPENDAHWTSNNLPSLEYLSDVVGKKVARGDVEAVAEGYTRAKARSLRGS